MDVSSLLTEWGFESLIDIFQENDIDYEALIILTPDLIKNLIPKIGTQAKFLKKLENHKLIMNSEFISLESDSRNDKVINIEDESSTSTATTCSSFNSDVVIPIEQYTYTPTKEPGLTSFYGEEELERLLNPTKQFNLKLLLEESCMGKIILKEYSDNKTLNNKCRSTLVETIISHFFKNHGSYLSNEQLHDIAQKIVDTFPNEKIEIYYVKPIKKSTSKFSKSQVARGKLVDKYRNCRTKLREAGLLPKHSSASVEDSNVNVNSELTDNVKDSKQWLLTRTDPWNDVINHWNITYDIRQNSNLSNIHDFLNEWPPLKLSTGYSLIDIDFDKLFPEKGLLFLQKWEQFFKTIYEIKKDILNDTVLELVSLLEDETLSLNSKNAIQLSMLPYLIPPKGRSRKGKEHWKASILECQQALILHAKIPADIEVLIEKKIKTAKEAKQTVQPYIIILGPSISNIENAYVVLDSVRYAFDSVLRAFEICFKAFHVCNLLYPFQAEHIYMLVQLCIFKIKTKWDKTIPYIMDLVATLEQN